MTTFEDLLDAHGAFAYKTKGTSMKPLLKQNRDVITIAKKKERLKPLDVALYKRNSDYVLHRVIKLTKDGYLIRGDNTYALENVKEEQVLGVMTALNRNGKDIKCTDLSYRIYSRLWTAIYLARQTIIKVKRSLIASIRNRNKKENK